MTAPTRKPPTRCPRDGMLLQQDGFYVWCPECAWEPGDPVRRVINLGVGH